MGSSADLYWEEHPLPRRKSEATWRKVEDEMPPQWETVLAVSPTFPELSLAYVDEINAWIHEYSENRIHVTHWRPLPAAPATEDEK